MIFICVKWRVRPEYADRWVELTRELTGTTPAEEGNLFFQWSRSVDDPNEYVLIEAFKDDAAEAHVTADHFKRALAELPRYVQETPLIRGRGHGRRPLAPARGVRGRLTEPRPPVTRRASRRRPRSRPAAPGPPVR